MDYVDRRELLPTKLDEEQFRQLRHERLQRSTTVYVGGMSFYTTEQQVCSHFKTTGPLRGIVMGLNRFKRTPCGFCFVEFVFQDGAARAVGDLHKSLLDDCVISVSWDVGGVDENSIRRWGRGHKGDQVVEEYRLNFIKSRRGFGARRGAAAGVDGIDVTDTEVVYRWVTPIAGGDATWKKHRTER